MMIEAGVLDERERVELIAGELIVPPSEGPLHASLACEIAGVLRGAYPHPDFTVREGHPIALDDMSEPEPDLAVVIGRRFFARHPRGDETLLVIEIAHSSLKLDRAMTEIYARGGVHHYWIVDCVGRAIEHHSLPQPDGTYRITGRETLTLPGTDCALSIEQLLAD